MTDILSKLQQALRAVAPRLRDSDVSQWATVAAEPMRSSGIVTANRVAAFLGQCSVESAGFSVLEENLYYSAERLCVVWPNRFPSVEAAQACARNPITIANTVYASRMGNGAYASGDGYTFRGGGLIQLTGRGNFRAFGVAIGKSADEAASFARTPAGAVASACWFWSDNGLNALADGWQLTRMTKVINGGDTALGRRIDLCNAALAAIKGEG